MPPESTRGARCPRDGPKGAPKRPAPADSGSAAKRPRPEAGKERGKGPTRAAGGAKAGKKGKAPPASRMERLAAFSAALKM